MFGVMCSVSSGYNVLQGYFEILVNFSLFIKNILKLKLVLVFSSRIF